MALKVYPVKFEIHDDVHLLCTVSSCDVCAEIDMRTVVTLEVWDELSAAIRKAIEAINESA